MLPIRPVASHASSIRKAALLLAGAAMLSGCAPGADLPPLLDARARTYTLGSGDVVRVTTFGEQSLTGEFRVNDSGDIAVPLIGPIRAGDLTVTALAGEIATKLREKNLYRDPNVSVEIASYRPFFILGEVTRPGKYPYEPGMTVLTAVAVAGGFTYRAIEDSASIIRLAGGKAVESRALRETLVQPGDVVTVFERTF